MPLLNVVTAVSREYNLPRMLHSMRSALPGTGFLIKWIQVFDPPGPRCSYGHWLDHEGGEIRILRLPYTGPRSIWAVAHKNFGMDQAEDGFYLCLDDDNVLHPAFLKTMARALAANPGKRAFVVGQRRWDHHGDMPAAPERVAPGFIDSAQFMLHTALIGKDRYDTAQAGAEDGHFVANIHKRMPGEFVFVDEVASYFNYLRVEPMCG